MCLFNNAAKGLMDLDLDILPLIAQDSPFAAAAAALMQTKAMKSRKFRMRLRGANAIRNSGIF
jgi:hypothetical protein